jgi:hypothetical protein
MKIEVLDAAGKVVGTVPVSERRGVSRVTWSMHFKPPRVPPAAVAAGGAIVGPRLLPGTYTVRMTRDTATYTTRLRVVPDPRSTHTLADRQAQLTLATRLAGLLTDMSFDVERMVGVRDALDGRAASLPAGDTLAARLRSASAAVDSLRRRIVATKEGGMITGEERLREYLADLYGGVVGYEGRPSQTQVERSAALAHELADVVAGFDAWVAKDLGPLNAALAARQLQPIAPLTRAQWDAAEAARRR